MTVQRRLCNLSLVTFEVTTDRLQNMIWEDDTLYRRGQLGTVQRKQAVHSEPEGVKPMGDSHKMISQ